MHLEIVYQTHCITENHERIVASTSLRALAFAEDSDVSGSASCNALQQYTPMSVGSHQSLRFIKPLNSVFS